VVDQLIDIGPGKDFAPHACPTFIIKMNLEIIISKIRSKIRTLTFLVDKS
jgi:hypothetical protein